MTSYDGWPDTAPYSELMSAQSEVARLKDLLEGQGIPTVTLVGEFREETAADTAVVQLMKRYNQVVEHTLAYKNLLHDMQEKYWAAESKVAAQDRTIKAQRAVIARLEKRLGIDDNL